jgi:ribosomal protein S18 acetylase RimI-like enzyme
MEIIEYTIDRYDDVMALMQQTPGVSVRSADLKEATERYLVRNPGLNFLAVDKGKVIGCAMCGHDGRRGYLQHVIVAVPYRGKGIANALVERCLAGLESLGIVKAHLDVFVTNDVANRYWTRRGWKKREDINRYSLVRGEDKNA